MSDRLAALIHIAWVITSSPFGVLMLMLILASLLYGLWELLFHCPEGEYDMYPAPDPRDRVR